MAFFPSEAKNLRWSVCPLSNHLPLRIGDDNANAAVRVMALPTNLFAPEQKLMVFVRNCHA